MTTILVAGCSSGIGEHLFNFYDFRAEYDTFGISRTTGTHVVDALDSQKVELVIDEIKPDILINCIGVAKMNLAIMSTAESYDQVVTANVKSAFLLAKYAARHMLKKRWGRIVNFGSCTQHMEIEGEALYTASKCGLYGFSRVLAREIAPYITVNMVSPGPVRTRLIAGVPDDKIKKIVDRQIIKKMATFEDIEKVVSFLISDEASAITGQNIYINGAG